MFGAFKRWLFLKALSDIKKRKSSKAPLHQNPTQTIHILYEDTSENDHLAVQDLIRQLKLSGKKVETLAFDKEKTTLPADTLNIYNPKNIGFNYVPSGESVDHFLSKESDVLIVLAHHFHEHMRYITYACDSYFKLGMVFPKSETYLDAMIEVKPSQSYSAIIKEMLLFMEKFSFSK
ncbi:MAG: hypothetical protein WAT79_11250 [Saprospiraceae bacterium]